MEVAFVQPRQTVEVHLSDNRVLSGPRGATIGEFFEKLDETDMPPVVGAIVNNELRELTYPIQLDSYASPVTMGDADGMRIYRRSLVFLLETAFSECFAQEKLVVDHSVSSGGYYCQAQLHSPFDPAELQTLEDTMRKLVNLDLNFKREQVPLEVAVSYFKAQGADDKIRLLAHRKKDYLTLYELQGYHDYHHGYMVPSTGYLKWFSLVTTDEGFTLRFPRRHKPTELLPMPEYPKLLNTFRQYGNWLETLGISSVGALNDAIETDRIREIILVSEALHEQHVIDIASHITQNREHVRIVTVAGPSSSGKTTFSKRLSIQLLASGISPFPLEMDNYFIDRDKTPLGENGKPDFESTRALNRIRLAEDLRSLASGELVQLPHYDFITGKSEPGQEVQITKDQIIILEGIHGLNPELLNGLPPHQTMRIFCSALTQLNLDNHNRISTTDTRLLRRIVRDARERGYSALHTIQTWESVRRGEKRNIFPYQENSDMMFNSALAYELSALKPLAEPLLRQVPYGTPEYIEAKRLLAFLEWFLPLESDLIPDNSILREFIGGSILRGFTLWHH